MNIEDDEWGMFKEAGMHEMTLSEIEERYHIAAIISQNRNASVRLAIHNVTGDQVAIKILNKSTLREQHKKILLLREISTLKLLGDNKHVTELYDVIDSGDRIWVIMEYASGGELFDFVKAKAPLPDSTAREVFRPIVKVVVYMNSLNLVHRDLKLENVLLDHRGQIRLADFGFSRYFDPTDSLIESVCGTPHYSPPEVIKAIPYNPIYVDSWSLGVILFVLLCGDFPFKGLSIPELLQSIVKADLKIPPNPTEIASDLLIKLLNSDPTQRYSPSEILKHPWINKNRLPKNTKKDLNQRINRAAMQEVKNLGIVKDGQEEDLDLDQLICYRLIRRKYQLGTVQLPALPMGQRLGVGNIPEFHPSSSVGALPTTTSTNRRPRTTLTQSKQKNFPMGMNSPIVRERLPQINSFLHINPIKYKISTIMQKNIGQKNHNRLRDIRKGQTMRFRKLGPGELELPILNCQHTTLDSVEILWEKIFSYMKKDESIDIITETDYGLYCKINGQKPIYFSLNVGCVHRGFGLIGFSLQNIRGDPLLFEQFETKLSEHMGF